LTSDLVVINVRRDLEKAGWDEIGVVRVTLDVVATELEAKGALAAT
jgi:hypothetical protein